MEQTNYHETPILFSSPMVQAIMDGVKTMTRRLITKYNSRCGTLLTSDGQGWHSFNWDDVVIDGKNSNYNYLKVAVPADGTRHRIFCKYHPADTFTDDETATLLWVREGFQIIPPNMIFYKADVENKAKTGWKPSIHMPKEAARLYLPVTGVKAERLHDISETDCLKEGVRKVTKDDIVFKYCIFDDGDKSTTAWQDMPYTAKECFFKYWIKLHGKESYLANPWLWAPEFTVLSRTGRPESFPEKPEKYSTKTTKNIPNDIPKSSTIN
jgi:hypothetical protein